MLGAVTVYRLSPAELVLLMGVGFVLVAGLVGFVLFLTRPRSEEIEDAEEP
jgi:hypothetical protein